MRFDVTDASRGGAVEKTARRTKELEAPQVPAPEVPLTPLALLQAPLALLQAPLALLQALLQAPPQAQPLVASLGGAVKETARRTEELEAPEVPVLEAPLVPLALLQAPLALLQAPLQAPP